MKKAEVKFENITKKFNETVAVDNVSCSFEAGTLTTLLGPSGCGKTTSLRIIAGLERATEGKILIGGQAPIICILNYFGLAPINYWAQ